MKKLLFTLFLGITGVFVYAQTTETILYTWMTGANTLNAAGSYGTKGVASATNTPPSKYASMSWTDSNGNLWTFGGESNTGSKYNHLMKYTISTNEWTWVSGVTTTNATGVYGTKGTAAAANTPGARSNSVTWKGADGNLYLFGGYGNATTATNGDLSDLWKFDVTTNQWTWMAGSNAINTAGVYSTIGVFSATCSPEGRSAATTWVDNFGNFWMYGGYSITGNKVHSDLWKFDVTLNQWAYMGGSQSKGIAPTYGTKGTPAATNFPGARYGMAGAADANNNLWLYGGSNASANLHNDLWKYDITLGQWTWMSGANTVNQAGVYGTIGVASASNVTGARRNSLGWEKNNCIYIHGGWGQYSTSLNGHLNDLWKYDISSNQWTWISGINGRNSASVYGTKGVTAVSNSIGGRSESISFKDNTGSFWILGGRDFSTGVLNNTNDLWKLDFCNAPTAVNATAPSNTLICAAQTTTLSATGVGAIGWYTAATGGTFVAGGNNFITPTLTSTTTYYIQDSTCGPGTRVAVTVSVMPIPNLAVANLSVCANGSVNLVASGANTYTWSTGSNSATLTTFPSANETYTLSGTNTTNGCTNTIVRTLTVVPLPTLTVTPNYTICSGKSVTIGAAGANTYQWSSGPTTASITVSPGTTTNYTVTGFGTGNCSSKVIIPVTVNASPVLTLTPASTTLCAGSVMTLSVSGAPSYTWNSGANTNTLQISPTSNTSYTVIGEAVNGCTTAAVKNISTLVSPTVSITGSTLTCAGSPIALIGTGATTYTWSTGVFTSSITPSPTTTTTYSLIGKNANVCTKTATILVTVNQLPVLSITPTNTTICLGSTYTLTASGADTYTWSNSSNVSSIVVSPTVNTTYSLTGLDLTTGCSKAAVKTLSVLALPNVTIGGTNQPVCIGGIVSLTGNGAVTYTWSTGQATANILPTPSVTTAYTLTGTAANSCTNSAVKTITVNPLPTLTVTGNNVVCSGISTTLTASGANTYTWSAGFISPVISIAPTSSITYSVIGKDANNCTNTTTYSVTVNQLPTLNVTTTNTLLCTGETSTLSVLGATSYTWSDNSNGTDIVVTPTSTTNYTVTGVDANNCSNSSVFTQSVSVCTGIQNVNNNSNSLIVFPNPSNGVFTIQSQKEDVLSIINDLGQIIQTIELNQRNNYMYQANDLQNGIYFLVGKTIKHKVVVSK